MKLDQVSRALEVGLLAMTCVFPAQHANARTWKLICVGNNYDSVWGSIATAMHPSFTLILSAKLPPNLNYTGTTNVTPVSWSGSDGDLTWNSKTTKLRWTTSWAFGTDNLGNITVWQIGIGYESANYNTWYELNETSLDSG